MKLRTRYGVLSGCIGVESDADGNVTACSFEEENRIALPCGTLIPRWGEENVRRKAIASVRFFPGGALRRVALESQTPVRTPLGPLPAELVTFYEDGALQRVFPLNGKLSGYWSEQDEAKLAVPVPFRFPFGSFSVKIVSVHFYRSGKIRSITFFPGEQAVLQTPAGPAAVRIGFSLYEDGALRSAEPAQPVLLRTPIGGIRAFDPGAVGIHADNGSLRFTKEGRIRTVTAYGQKVEIRRAGLPPETVAPLVRPSPLDETKTIVIPVSIRFEAGRVLLDNGSPHRYPLSECSFSVLPAERSASCADCSLCGKCGSPP